MSSPLRLLAPHVSSSACIDPGVQKVKGQGHTVTKTITVARLLVTCTGVANYVSFTIFIVVLIITRLYRSGRWSAAVTDGFPQHERAKVRGRRETSQRQPQPCTSGWHLVSLMVSITRRSQHSEECKNRCRENPAASGNQMADVTQGKHGLTSICVTSIACMARRYGWENPA